MNAYVKPWVSPDSLVYVTIQNILKPNFEVYVLVNINPGIERGLA